MEPYRLQDFGGRFLISEPVHLEGKIWPGISAYIEWFVPAEPRAVSVLFVRGGGGQGSEFLRTPDGRPGWAHNFLRAGYPVYILDRPVTDGAPGTKGCLAGRRRSPTMGSFSPALSNRNGMIYGPRRQSTIAGRMIFGLATDSWRARGRWRLVLRRGSIMSKRLPTGFSSGAGRPLSSAIRLGGRAVGLLLPRAATKSR